MNRKVLFLVAAIGQIAATAAVAGPVGVGTSLSTGVAAWTVNGNPVAVLSPIATPFWISNFGDGRWVGATSNDGNVVSGANSGSYVFSLNFSGFTSGPGTFDLQYSADNSVSWSITHGTLSGATVCGLADCFSAIAGAPRSISGSFAANSILTASVTNIGSGKSPMGLLAVGTYVASAEPGGPGAAPVPEPMTWVMMVSGFAVTGGAVRLRRQKVHAGAIS